MILEESQLSLTFNSDRTTTVGELEEFVEACRKRMVSEKLRVTDARIVASYGTTISKEKPDEGSR